MLAMVTVAVLALGAGCAGDDPESADPETPSSSPSASEDAEDGPVIDSDACDAVRSGIDAFNVGEFDETVAHFEEAVPLAEARDDGSQPASELIEAVRYYAELDPDLYAEAAQGSADFAKYKAITLGQCVSGQESPEEPGVEV